MQIHLGKKGEDRAKDSLGIRSERKPRQRASWQTNLESGLRFELVGTAAALKIHNGSHYDYAEHFERL